MKPPTPRLKVPKRQKWIPVLPVTLGNAVCGFSNHLAAKVGPETPKVIRLSRRCSSSGWCSTCSMGTPPAHEADQQFWPQLDSLGDVITFMARRHVKAFDGLSSAALVGDRRAIFCALLRLARFNVETDEQDSRLVQRFLPAAAGWWPRCHRHAATPGIRPRDAGNDSDLGRLLISAVTSACSTLPLLA